MSSWHERDCRRPDVVLMGDIPACRSCGSLFFNDEDGGHAQLNKQTASVDQTSAHLNLDWPSSITFSGPNDVTNPNLRHIIYDLDRNSQIADPRGFEMMLQEHKSSMRECTATGPLTGDAPTDCETQTFEDRSDLGANPGKAERDSNSPNDVYQSFMSTDEIRILHLDPPDTVSQPLHGHLRPTRLSRRPYYTALSYTWADANGDRSLCETIFIGNAWTPLAITSNCAAALRRLRSREGTRIVWVDAICINQTNDGEKSHQVSIMRDIYSRAESVTVFLGGEPGKDIGTPAGHFLQKLSDDRLLEDNWITGNLGGEVDYVGICDLFGHQYWSRIWVIQEVLLARKAEIILGNASVLLHDFIDKYLERLPSSVKVPEWIRSQGLSRFGDADAFFDLLERTSMCKASDERDMVFALFGLVQGASLEGLVADYSKTLAEIYIGLAAYFLIRHAQSRLLGVAASTTKYAAQAARARMGRKFIADDYNLQVPGDGEQDDHIWRSRLPSWVPFAKPADLGDTELLHYRNTTAWEQWCRLCEAINRTREYDSLTAVQPGSWQLPHTSLNAFKVFGNHGTLLVRASVVAHMWHNGSAVLYGAFTSTSRRTHEGRFCLLAATETSIEWEICVQSSAYFARDDNWVIEVPGCDTFLHIEPSVRVPGTYKIASLSSVLLVRDYHPMTTENSAITNPPDVNDILSPAADAAEDYRFWMPLVECDLQHLLFLRHWELWTRMDKSASIVNMNAQIDHDKRSRDTIHGQPGSEYSFAELSPEVLEKYGQWLQFKSLPHIRDNLKHTGYDAVVRTVSNYLEKWENYDVWSRMHEIVVEVPWQAKLDELTFIKADAWQYLVARNVSKAGGDEKWRKFRWESNLQELFDDLVRRLPAIPLQPAEIEPSLGSFISTDTYLALRNSIKNVPDSWTVEELCANEAEIFKDWVNVESFWEFMERSKPDCIALRGKFVQIHALKQLCRREQREFLIC